MPTARTPRGADPVVACTLGAADLAAQAQRWARLRRRAERDRVATPQGARLRFRAGEGVAEELEELVAVERECCAWASWTVERAGDDVVLDVRSIGAGVDALHAMFGRA